MATAQKYPPVDYLKFIFACDEEMFQNDYALDFQRLQADANDFGAKSQYFKLTVLGGGRTVGSRYVVECVGPVAEYLSLRIPLVWYRRLTRIDFRSELRTLAASDLDKAASYYLLTQAKTRNVSALDTRPRNKAVGRDTGGKGISLASRKSGVCGTVYRRGKELPAYELRILNKSAAELRDAVWQDYGPTAVVEFINIFYALTAPLEEELLNDTLQIKRPSDIPSTFALVARTMPDVETLPTVEQLRMEDKAQGWADDAQEQMMKETSGILLRRKRGNGNG
jgi:hypothetical protein